MGAGSGEGQVCCELGWGLVVSQESLSGMESPSLPASLFQSAASLLESQFCHP